ESGQRPFTSGAIPVATTTRSGSTWPSATDDNRVSKRVADPALRAGAAARRVPTATRRGATCPSATDDTRVSKRVPNPALAAAPPPRTTSGPATFIRSISWPMAAGLAAAVLVIATAVALYVRPRREASPAAPQATTQAADIQAAPPATPPATATVDA